MVSRFDSVIAAYPYLRDRLRRLNARALDVTNYPVPNEFEGFRWDGEKENAICYIGAISRIRGICELIDSLAMVDVTLHLAGTFQPPQLLDEVKQKPGWGKVVYSRVRLSQDRRVDLRSSQGRNRDASSRRPLPQHHRSENVRVHAGRDPRDLLRLSVLA